MRLNAFVCLSTFIAITHSACDSDKSGAEPVGVPMPIGCAWKDFDATVRSGPHAGTNLHGRLVLAVSNDASDELFGQLTLRDNTVLAVRGTRDADLIGLTFFTPDGAVEGEGPIAGAGAFCKEGLAGELTGPQASDTGDWLGVGLVSYDNSAYEGTVDPPPSGLNNGTVDFNDNRNVSPACSQYTTDSGAQQTICQTQNPNGTTTTCIVTYYVGATVPITHCSTTSNGGSRPGVDS